MLHQLPDDLRLKILQGVHTSEKFQKSWSCPEFFFCPRIWNLLAYVWKYFVSVDIVFRSKLITLQNILDIIFLIYQPVDAMIIIYVFFLLSVQYFFACYPDFLEIICMLFLLLKGFLPNLASNLSQLINFYSPWN